MFKKCFLFCSLLISLQACVFVAGAAAGAAGVAVVYDHRKLDTILTDNRIVNKTIDRINADPASKDSHINVSCFNRTVLITGQVLEPALKQQADEIAHSVAGVRRVYNQLTIGNPTTTLVRTNDAWLTTKVRTALIATQDLQSSTIKVVTEDSTVYLMGTVKRDQGDIAATVASQVAGVSKVVKIFQ